jgi:uncharacterized membrane protein (DUF485 family)
VATNFHLLRPRFELVVDLSAGQARERLAEGLGEVDEGVIGDVYSDHVELNIPTDERHFWSPQLKLVFYEEPEGRALVDGRFGPNPNLWTLFLAAYVFFLMIGFAGLMIGTSQWGLGQTPTGLSLLLVGGIGFVGVFVISRIGQRLADEQMDRLGRFVRHRFEDVMISEA